MPDPIDAVRSVGFEAELAFETEAELPNVYRVTGPFENGSPTLSYIPDDPAAVERFLAGGAAAE